MEKKLAFGSSVIRFYYRYRPFVFAALFREIDNTLQFVGKLHLGQVTGTNGKKKKFGLLTVEKIANSLFRKEHSNSIRIGRYDKIDRFSPMPLETVR